MTAFLLAQLKSEAEANKVLAPENVIVPGISYEMTAFIASPTK